MQYYHGYDLSLTGSGVVVLDENLNPVYAKTLKNNLRGCERLRFIRDEIKKVMFDFPPTAICIEDYIMHMQAGQAFAIGELGGVIKTMLYEHGYDPVLVSPTRLKKFITGKGVAEKDMIVFSVYKYWGYEAADNDVADGYGLARLAYTLVSDDVDGLTAPQKEVLKDIHNPPPKKKKSIKANEVPTSKRKKPVLLRRRTDAS